MGSAVDDVSISGTTATSDALTSALADAHADSAARERLFDLAAERMRTMARTHLNRFPRLRRWSRSDDVMQEGIVRLLAALEQSFPRTPVHFYRLFALQLRRLLVDLHRASYGPEGRHRHHDSPSDDARTVDAVCTRDPAEGLDVEALHEAVDRLPDELRQLVELHSYSGLTGTETAALLGISPRHFWRQWGEIKARLANDLC